MITMHTTVSDAPFSKSNLRRNHTQIDDTSEGLSRALHLQQLPCRPRIDLAYINAWSEIGPKLLQVPHAVNAP